MKKRVYSECIQEGSLEFEQELAYAKLRIQLHKELDEEVEDEEEKVELTLEEEEKMEEIEAKIRPTFDPVTKVYDDRKRRVTYLQ